jgi:TRAP-type C4-dicarboxylate transport system substrate-binding protein
MAFGSEVVRVAVVAPADEQHLAWVAAARLQEVGKQNGVQIIVEAASLLDSVIPLPDLLVMPVRSLATKVPELQILELPFFFTSVDSVHKHLDGELGNHLAEQARKQGWQIVAFWDDGMHVFSGLKRYDRVRNLKAREFLLTRPDPLAEKQFRYWKANSRRIDPRNSEAVLSECLIANRAASPQEILREKLYRVHLAISLTNHRYEGWVAVSPAQRWAQLNGATREKLGAVLRETTGWQRKDARKRKTTALDALKRHGMSIYEVDSKEREAFREALPDWTKLLGDELDAQEKRDLIGLASTGAAAVARVGAVESGDVRRDPAPSAEASQDNESSH